MALGPAASAAAARCGFSKRALLQEQLADGPKPGVQVEAAAAAAAIPERALLAATDALSVRCQRGEWRLPET